MTRVWARWVPAVVAAVVIAGGTVAVSAAPDVDLPDKSPQEVLALVAGHSLDGFSGTIEKTTDLGLPELPPGADKFGTDDIGSALDFLTGSHTARIFVDGHDKARVQVLDQLAERDVVVNGQDVWLYDSSKATAVHLTVPEKDAAGDHAGDYSPADLADKLLDHVTPSTEVTVGDDTQVAGRDAYQLVLTPRTSDTLVESISIAVDAETGLPLALTVEANGQEDPAIEVAFTSLTIGAPPADTFEFTPPEGTDVVEHTLTEKSGQPIEHPMPQVSGSDWSTVLEFPAGTVPAELTESPLWAELTSPVAEGQLLSTSLLNVLVTPDGRVFVGAVPAEVLQAAAAG